jgi:peptidoglycan/LPS O-acetylase OafA/YrhL
MKGGFVGVDIFFVISGYLIGTLIYREIRVGSFDIGKFYERRAKRILPALFGVLLFCYIAALLLLSPMEIMRFARQALAAITSTSNILFWQSEGYFAPKADQNPLLMTWSLGVEEQFYIFFPLSMLILARVPIRVQIWVIGSLASLSLVTSIWGTSYYPWATFYLLPSRAWELAAGVLLAMYEANQPQAENTAAPAVLHMLSILGLALICVAIGILDTSMPFPGYWALLPVCGAVLIIFAKRGAVNRMLSWRPVVFIGLISYSWYLWHWPLLSFANIISDRRISTSVGIIIGLLSLGCAALSHRFVEQPFRKSSTSTALLLKKYTVLALGLMIPSGIFLATNGLPQRNPKAEMVEMPVLADKCLAPSLSSHLRILPECLPDGPEPAIALIGDSHAAAIVSGLNLIAKRSGYRLLVLNRAGCPPLVGITHFINRQAVNEEDDQGCEQYNQQRLAYVTKDPKIRAVVFLAYWSRMFRIEEQGGRYVEEGSAGSTTTLDQSRQNLYKGVERAVRQMEQSGKKVYLVQDNPQLDFDPVRHMLATLIGPRHAMARFLAGSTLLYSSGLAPAPPTAAEEAARVAIADVAALHPNVYLYDLRNELCNERLCRFALGNQVYYNDQEHLSSTGGQAALGALHLE